MQRNERSLLKSTMTPSASLTTLGKEICAKNQVDISTRKQQKNEKREQREQRAAKGGRPVNNSRPTAAATVQPAVNDAAAGAEP